MELQGSVAVVHGAAGALGSAIVRALARDGATVHLTGRTRAPLDLLAAEVGGTAAQVDATDPQAVAAHLDGLGQVDIAVNTVGADHVQGVPLRELSLDDYLQPIVAMATTQFVTATAAARQMASAGRGVIVILSTTAGRVGLPSDGFGPACAAVEAFARQLATEVGPSGVRVVCVRPDAVPGSVAHGSHAAAMWSRAAHARGSTLQEAIDGGLGVPGALLADELTLDAVGDVVAFLASDRARAMTATVTNVSRGALPDL
ncbi:SDR family NAD(P)-dependent oxidoreductase [Cellulomonas xylanilytica]|uniref:3-oxoacyl-ACP reductase n=1 Tax=Cellulomonas xylanilytica TaxID=233583 RepID=A0A510V204_9CELL|nr:SDR family oxidoreductase [Cellulomonas xylanilytica]GEK20922.1 3-oxoacyl-ACP reductase [Cellulomonas xylanilytica]